MTKRKSFSPEIKKEAAILILDKGYTTREAGVAIGASESAVRSWAKQLELERQGVTPTGAKAITADHQEIQILRAEVKQLKLEKEILKKASALLMSDSFRSVR